MKPSTKATASPGRRILLRADGQLPYPSVHGPDNSVFLYAPPPPAAPFASINRARNGKGVIEGVLGFATR